MTVKERRSKLAKGRKIATFGIALEAVASDMIVYVPDLDEGKGFLSVMIEDETEAQSLPAYLKVRLESADQRREYFTILEGPYRNKAASVKKEEDGSSYFLTGVKHEPVARAKYSISQKIFLLNGKKYQAVDYQGYPWQKGLYDIEIPDYFHDGGRNYLSQSKRAGTWFKIGHTGERYLHAGGISLGCMTVTEVGRWNEIYDALIKARKGDLASVGILEIVD